MSSFWIGISCSLIAETSILFGIWRYKTRDKKYVRKAIWSSYPGGDLSRIRLELAKQHCQPADAVLLIGLIVMGLWPILVLGARDLFPALKVAAINLVMFALSLATWLLHSRARGRRNQEFFSMLKDAGGKVCPICLYQLRDKTGRCNCPECGTLVDLELVKKVWLGEQRTE